MQKIALAAIAGLSLGLTQTAEAGCTFTGDKPAFIQCLSNHVPLGFATISSSASVLSGSGNISATWDAASSRYVVTFTGESYFYADYTTQVTPICSAATSARTDSLGGNLLVYIYNSAGSPIQCNFAMTTNKGF